MEFEGIVIDLSTVTGIALLTSVLVRFFVKQPLEKKHKEADWYGIAINAITLLIAALLTALGTMIANAVMDKPELGNAILRALIAAIVAIGGYEGVSNAWHTIRPPKKPDGEA